MGLRTGSFETPGYRLNSIHRFFYLDYHIYASLFLLIYWLLLDIIWSVTSQWCPAFFSNYSILYVHMSIQDLSCESYWTMITSSLNPTLQASPKYWLMSTMSSSGHAALCQELRQNFTRNGWDLLLFLMTSQYYLFRSCISTVYTFAFLTLCSIIRNLL